MNRFNPSGPPLPSESPSPPSEHGPSSSSSSSPPPPLPSPRLGLFLVVAISSKQRRTINPAPFWRREERCRFGPMRAIPEISGSEKNLAPRAHPLGDGKGGK